MADLALVPLAVDDAAALFAFEVENRSWFEGWVGPRPDSYWEQSSLREIIRRQVDEGELMYLVKRSGDILGRVNLTAEGDGVAQLGYRIGERYGGQGVATAAIALALDQARDRGLWALEARVLDDNIASARVLEKNGFRKTVSSEMDGRPLTLYRCDLG